MKNKNTHTLNVIVNEFARHGVNIIQLLESINAIITDNRDFVTITIVKDDGSEVKKKLPSLGKMRNDLTSAQNFLDDLHLVRNNNTFVESNGIKYPILVKEYPYDLEAPNNISRITFTHKNDNLYARIFIGNLKETLKYKKYILDITQNRFDDIEALNEEDLLEYIEENNIKYTINTDLISSPPLKIRYNGTFGVINSKANLYTLTTLNYTNLKNETFRLEKNDVLFFGNTEVIINSIDYNNNQVELNTVKGYQQITTGTQLKILSQFNEPEYIDIPFNIEERSILFLKNINKDFFVESYRYSNAIKLSVNNIEDKSATDEDNTNDSNRSIVDFNINELVQRKNISRTLGEKPNAPQLNADDFKVVRVNEHLFHEKLITSVQDKLSRKNELVSELSEIDKSLEKSKAILTATGDISKEKIASARADINTLTNKRKIKSNEYLSIINELSSINKDKIKFIKPKFRTRGFFDIPNEIYTQFTGTQHIVKFIISYRYLGKNEETSQNKNFVRSGDNGNKKVGVFSDWVETESVSRIKVTDDNGNTYWEEQKTEDGQQVNINQVDIPIQRGETVELRIRSVSEAGYPQEPLLSTWSNIVRIPFPEEITDVNELSEAIEDTLNDSANILVENVITSKGLDVHINNSITKNEEYYAHPAKEISSGLFDNSGNIINLEKIIKNQQNEIDGFKRQLVNDIGKLNMSILTPNGEEIEISNNATNSVFTGYYIDDISLLPEEERNGAIITKDYQLFIYNTSGVPIRFRSGIHGGVTQALPVEYELSTDRKYEDVPIIFREDGSNFQQQNRGQILYNRYKDYGLNEELYINDANAYKLYVGQTDYLKQNEYTDTSPNLTDQGMYVYSAIDSRKNIYVGAPEYGSMLELKSGRENGIKIPIKVVYKLTDSAGDLPGTLTNVEFKKRIGFDIFLLQQNTISFDIDFSVKYNKDTF